MTLDEAINQACDRVGIIPPRGRMDMGRWLKADTTSGKNGKGDGRLIFDDARATAMNWQTGESVTVWTQEERTPEEKRRYAQRRDDDRKRDAQRAAKAASIAKDLVAAAKPDLHPYLARKGFAAEKALVVLTEDVRRIAGDYLVPADASLSAVVVPARIGQAITSAQLIWADGTKKFLYGGEMSAAAHRIAAGKTNWLCEGYATALSLRAALRGLNQNATVLVCFSAANIVKVAGGLSGQTFIAADHDAPPKAKPDQFGGLGAGEFFAQKTDAPYLIPPTVGTDINDLHQSAGIFEVQRLITGLLRRVPP